MPTGLILLALMVYSTDRPKAVVPVSLLLCDLFYEAICFMSCLLCFSILLALRLSRFGKRELVGAFVRLFDLRLFSSSSWCLGLAAVCDCGTPWTFLLPLFVKRR